MKSIAFILMLFLAGFLTAQTPHGINYQAVARDGNGQVLANTNVTVKFSILDNSPGGTVLYSENQTAATNSLGLFTLVIGEGNTLTGNMESIPWGEGSKFLRIEINNALVHTTELKSVPYALYAEKAATLAPDASIALDQIAIDGATDGQVIKLVNGHWWPQDDNAGAASYTAGSGISINGTTISNSGDADHDSGNELQNLSLVGNTLSISDGNSVALPVGTNYQGGAGIAINGNTISNTGDTNGADDITNNSTAGGDVSGNFASLTVDGIQGKPVSSTVPQANQVLQYNGSQWAPATIAAATGWSLNGNAGTTASNFIGTTDNKSLYFKVNNTKSGLIEASSNGNTGFGLFSMESLTNGYYNTGIGYFSLKSIVSGANNTALGYDALSSSVNANHNTAIGSSALTNNTTGYSNTAIGSVSLYENTTGSKNTAVGYYALHANNDEEGNTAVGYESLRFNDGFYNTAVGQGSMYYNSGDANTAVGQLALYNNNSGYSNAALGTSSLHDNTSGYHNAGVGFASLYSNTTGYGNTGLGYHAISDNTVGFENTGVGNNALSANTSGDYNTAVGTKSLLALTTGNSNTAVGEDGLQLVTTGINNTSIGASAYPTSSSAINNYTAIGYYTGGANSTSNRVEIGNSSVTWIGGQVNWSTYSDERVKQNIQENVPGLAFINQLRPVTYHYNIHEENRRIYGGKKESEWPEKYDIENQVFTGFIAQEVAEAAQKTGYDFSGVTAPTTEDGLYTVRYAEFVMPLVKSVQELSALVKEQAATIESLKQEVAKMKRK